MKRDMNLIRDILLAIEENPKLWTHNMGMRLGIEGVADDLVGYHLRLLADGGYLLVIDAGNHAVPLVQGLTWKGHDFVDATRPKGIWERVLAAGAKVGSMTIDVAVEIAKDLAKEQVRAAAGLS